MHRLQPAGAHAVRALLVFLDLLKGEAQPVAQLLLAHLQRLATLADAVTDMHIDGLGDRVAIITSSARESASFNVASFYGRFGTKIRAWNVPEFYDSGSSSFHIPAAKARS